MRIHKACLIVCMIFSVLFLICLILLPDGKMPSPDQPETPRHYYVIALLGHCLFLVLGVSIWFFSAIREQTWKHNLLFRILLITAIIGLWFSIVISSVFRILERTSPLAPAK